ncbi:MAG: CHRD domain-containing protein [Candidatus Eiseniibacteriota bacterium]
MRSRSLVPVAAVLLTAGPVLAYAPMKADLTGAQVVPPSGSPATGLSHWVVDVDANLVTYYVERSGLQGTETAAEIRGFAPVGSESALLHTLPAGNPKVGEWSYSEADEASILGGLAYVEIRTTMHPSGEVRGQVVVHPTVNFANRVDPDQACLVSPGLGVGFYTVDTVANTLAYDVRFAGLTTPEVQAHIHGYQAVLCQQGIDFLVPVGPGNPKVGVWTYAEGDDGAVQGGELYVNIHTVLVPGGELRSQIIPVSPATAAPLLSSAAALQLAVAPNPAAAGGTVFRFAAPARGGVLRLLDVAGREMRAWRLEIGGEGEASQRWDGRDGSGRPAAGGVYFIRLEADGRAETRRVVVTR